MPQANTKQHAHELIDQMAPGQLSAVVDLLEMILDPLARQLATATWEDEEIDEDEERVVAESKAWLATSPIGGTSHEDLLAEFGVAKDAEQILPGSDSASR